MEVLGARPVYSMSDPEKVSALDAAMAELARLSTFVLQLTGELERTGYAQEAGAGDTARFLSKRYRMDLPKARRTVRLATVLDKHPVTTAAMPDPAVPFANPANAHPANDTRDESDAGSGDEPGDGGDDLRDGLAGADGSAGQAGAEASERVWRVHPDQAEAILAVLAKVPASVPVENVDFAEQRLIDLAATHTPQQLREAGTAILAILDPDGPEPSEKRAYARESLTWKNADQGVKFQGFLACENAELFRTVIRAGAEPRKTVDGEPDPRPWSKRQADALTTALTDALNPTISPSTGASTPNPTPGPTTLATTPTATRPESATRAATATRAEGAEGAAPSQDAEDSAPTDDTARTADASGGASSGAAAGAVADAGLAAGLDIGAGAGAGAGMVAGHGPKAHISVTIDFNDLQSSLSHATGTMMFGDILSAATVRRLACDAEILPIVLGSKSQPLDVGTSQRLVTQPMRRALNARDKGCVACGAPPTQCEAHHLKHWIDGGITAVSNLVLLCKRDHLDLHSGHWNIQIIDDVVHVTRPAWADPEPVPPNRYQPPHLPDDTTRPGIPDRRSPTDADRTGRDGRDGEGGDGRDGEGGLDSGRWLSVVGSTRPDASSQDEHNGQPSAVDHPAADTEPSPHSAPHPWGDNTQTSPPACVPAPKAPWADDPLPAPATPPLIPWADEPLPVTRPPTAPWTEPGFDPWADAPETIPHHSGSDSSGSDSSGSGCGGSGIGTDSSPGSAARADASTEGGANVDHDDTASRRTGSGPLGSVA